MTQPVETSPDRSHLSVLAARSTAMTLAIDAIPIPVIVFVPTNGLIVAVNAACVCKFELDVTSGSAMRVSDLIQLSPEQNADVDRKGRMSLASCSRPDGSRFTGQVHISEWDGSGWCVATVNDVAPADLMRSEVLAPGHLDDLTHVMRRSAFAEAARLKASLRPSYGLLFIDVDDMKAANDRFGHAAGDRVLVAVAERLSSTLRHGDHTGRYGGDEFISFVRDVETPDQLKAIVAVLRRTICRPLIFDCHVIDIQVSIGAALCSSSTPLKHAIALADKAMYANKRFRKSAGLLAAGRTRTGRRSASHDRDDCEPQAGRS